MKSVDRYPILWTANSSHITALALITRASMATAWQRSARPYHDRLCKSARATPEAQLAEAPLVESIRAEGCPMAGTAQELTSGTRSAAAILHATFYFLSNPREEALRRSDHPASTKCAPTGNRGIASLFALPEAAGIRHDLSECQWRNLDPSLGIS